MPDPSCNPYLAFSAMLMAGLDAIKNRIEPRTWSTRTSRSCRPRSTPRSSSWFVRGVLDRDEPSAYRSPAEPDADWDGAVADDAVVADAFERWTAAYRRSDEIASGLDLDATSDAGDLGSMSLRARLLHSIEEYARHNGHADLLRERIDGRTGE